MNRKKLFMVIGNKFKLSFYNNNKVYDILYTLCNYNFL